MTNSIKKNPEITKRTHNARYILLYSMDYFKTIVLNQVCQGY